MKYLELETFNDFVCVGSECPFTCCGGGWNIFIDDDTDRYYRTVTGEMGDRLRNGIQRKNGKTSFVLDEHNNCPFLNKKGLCDIYLSLGEEHLSNTCKYYPRYAFRSGDIVFTGVSISCPEVSKFFLTHKEPLLIDFSEDETTTDCEELIEWSIFNWAVRVFTQAVEIAQNRNLRIKDRMALIILFVYQFQTHVDNGTDCKPVIDLFSDTSHYSDLLNEMQIDNRDYGSKIDFCSELLNYFGSIDNLEMFLPELNELKRHFSKPENTNIEPEQWIVAFSWMDREENNIQREQLLVYVLFRYLMKDYSKKAFFDKLMIGLELVFVMSDCITALMYIENGSFAESDERILQISHISRLIEHDFELGNKVLEYFKTKGICELPFVLKLIS